jgi:hypothetical protein
MAFLGNHRVLLVSPTLSGYTGMGVDIGNHYQTSLLAKRPEVTIIPAIEIHVSIVQAVRIEIVIISELSNPAPA